VSTAINSTEFAPLPERFQVLVSVAESIASCREPEERERTQLLQVLINLLVNGMDAMEGTPESARRLTVQTRAHGRDQIEIAVMDQGRSIAPDELRRLSEPLLTTKGPGMGLGLAIARSIVTAHPGRIWVENNADCGATFHVLLPVTRDGPE